MDPISALSLASNVIQCVDFVSKVLVGGLELYRSADGSSQENADREQSVTRLKSFTESLKIINVNPGQPDLRQLPSVPHELAVEHRQLSAPHIAEIQTIASDCSRLCDEIITLLNGLKLRKETSYRVFKTVAVIAKGLYKTKEIKSLEARLKTLEPHIARCFFLLLNEQQRYAVAIVQHISSQTESLSDGTTPGFQNIDKKLASMDAKISQLVLPTQPHLSKLKYKATPPRDLIGAIPKYAEDIASITDDFGVLGADLALLHKQQSFIKSLHTDGQQDRHESIPDAHRVTFEWVFPDESREAEPISSVKPDETKEGTKRSIMSRLLRQTKPTDHQSTRPPRQDLRDLSQNDIKRNYLSQWLRCGSGIFWVSGRPGSGKSTLMKFIADHRKTRNALKEWAGDKSLAIAAHYFWISGRTLQKSLKGMFLQLLYDIVRNEPQLGQDAFPTRFHRWNAGYSAEVTATRGEDIWTIEELTEALEIIARNAQMSIRICVFIDGLDEFDGDHYELCRILKSFESSTCIKLCVSSRPWNVFQEAFGSDPTKVIHVHELTYNDIKAFAKNRLKTFGVNKTLRLTTSDITQMGEYITETANGVFLWVVLATKTLRDGIVDGDTVGDLWLRLKDFPDELDPFFKRILQKIGRAHHKYMVEGFKIFLSGNESDLSRNCWYLTSYALTRHNTIPPTETEIYDCLDITYDQMQRRINARFGGLLITSEGSQYVTIIHRTASDFLQSGPIKAQFNAISPDFKPKLGLLRGLLCYMRWVFLKPEYPGVENCTQFFRELEEVSYWAMIEDPDETTRLLDFYRVMATETVFCSDEKKLKSIRWKLDQKHILYADDFNGVEAVEPVIDPTLDLARLFSTTYLDRKEAEGANMSLIQRFSGIRASFQPPHIFWGYDPESHITPERRLLVQAHQPFPTLWHMVLLAPFLTPPKIQRETLSFFETTAANGSPICTLSCPQGLERFGCTIYWKGSCFPLRCAISWQFDLPRTNQMTWSLMENFIGFFLSTTFEENRAQLADAMYYADASLHTPEGVELMLSDTTVFEFVLKKAIEKALPASSFEPLMKNSPLLGKLTEETRKRLTNYLASPAAAVVAESIADV